MPNGMTNTDLCAKIDETCDMVRLALVQDAVRTFEYQQAMTDAQAFASGGLAGAPPNQFQCPGNYQGTVPATVASWQAANSGWTTQQACQDILSSATNWTAAMEGLRTVRLEGKASVMACTDPDAMEAAFEAAINQAIAVAAAAAT